MHLYLGYKINQRVNAYLRQVVSDLSASGELPPQTHEYSVYKQPGPIGSFRFCMLRKMLAPESDVDSRERSAIALKYTIRRFAGSPRAGFVWRARACSTSMFRCSPSSRKSTA